MWNIAVKNTFILSFRYVMYRKNINGNKVIMLCTLHKQCYNSK